jgi:hypothetical protein
VDEVEQVRTALNLNRDNFYLYGSHGAVYLQWSLPWRIRMISRA